MGREHDVSGVDAALGQPLEQQVDRQGPHLPARLVDRGQADVAERGERRVVVADHRDVVGDPQAARLEGVQGAHRGQVVGDEEARRTPPGPEDGPDPLRAALLGERPPDHRGVRGQPVAPHGGQVPVSASPGPRRLGPAVDMGDPSVAELDEVVHGQDRPARSSLVTLSTESALVARATRATGTDRLAAVTAEGSTTGPARMMASTRSSSRVSRPSASRLGTRFPVIISER